MLQDEIREIPMRLAFADLFFSWPPHGGADADLYHTVSALQGLGHEVRVFVAGCEESWERGSVDPAAMPFPTTRLDFTVRGLNRRAMPQRFRAAVDAWKPDLVFLCDGFFLKPYVAEALAHYPLVARYYAYELTCPRDLRLFKDGAPCPMNYLRTPNACRPCALKGMAPEIERWRFLSWTHEYLAARAFMPAYHARLVNSLRPCKAVIVYNAIQKRQLEGFHTDVRMIPGGVNVDEFVFVPPNEKGAADRKIILMTGRTEDPVKGLRTLREAGDRLGRERDDFEIRVTHTDFSISNNWLKAIGWHGPAGVRSLYHEADVCVVPSIWEEPFGLVAVEAMASGRPVCASRAGGLPDIVVDGETGFLFDREDSEALARCLARLLDSPDLRRRMGEQGRARAETEFDWRRIAARYYPPLVETYAR
jgi:glycosyltransferase involved in cell wall biosynthesis